jgi:hypothetical protein
LQNIGFSSYRIEIGRVGIFTSALAKETDEETVCDCAKIWLLASVPAERLPSLLSHHRGAISQ